MTETIKNELTTEIKDNKIYLHRHIIDEMDAEEFIRSVEGMRTNMESQAKQLEAFKIDYNILHDRINEVNEIRTKEIAERKKEIEEAMKKEKEKQETKG